MTIIAIRLLSFVLVAVASVALATGAILAAVAGWLNSFDINDT